MQEFLRCSLNVVSHHCRFIIKLEKTLTLLIRWCLVWSNLLLYGLYLICIEANRSGEHVLVDAIAQPPSWVLIWRYPTQTPCKSLTEVRCLWCSHTWVSSESRLISMQPYHWRGRHVALWSLHVLKQSLHLNTFLVVVLCLTLLEYVFYSFDFKQAFVLIVLVPDFLTALWEPFLGEWLIGSEKQVTWFDSQ